MLIVTTEASIVCFHEMKMELICLPVVLKALGSDFEDFVYLPVIGTRSGILFAWKTREVTITNLTCTTNILSSRL